MNKLSYRALTLRLNSVYSLPQELKAKKIYITSASLVTIRKQIRQSLTEIRFAEPDLSAEN